MVYDDDDFTSYMFYLEDLETLNGTDVNGLTIGSRSKPGLPFLLTNGDEIFVQPNWKLKFQQNAGSRKEKLEVMQREDSLVQLADSNHLYILMSTSSSKTAITYLTAFWEVANSAKSCLDTMFRQRNNSPVRSWI